MKERERLSLEQVQSFLAGSAHVEFEAKDQANLYGWVTRTLREQHYDRLPKTGKGPARRYIAKLTGLSRAQMTRLIGQYIERRSEVSRGSAIASALAG